MLLVGGQKPVMRMLRGWAIAGATQATARATVATAQAKDEGIMHRAPGEVRKYARVPLARHRRARTERES